VLIATIRLGWIIPSSSREKEIFLIIDGLGFGSLDAKKEGRRDDIAFTDILKDYVLNVPRKIMSYKSFIRVYKILCVSYAPKTERYFHFHLFLFSLCIFSLG